METRENETSRIDVNGHVFYTRPLNENFDLIITDDDMIKSAMADLNKYYDDVVDLAYDDEDAELIVNIDGEDYWGEDGEDTVIFFVHKGMLQFRIAPGSGVIGFMINKEAHANQEKLEEAAGILKKVGESVICDRCGTDTYTEVDSDAE